MERLTDDARFTNDYPFWLTPRGEGHLLLGEVERGPRARAGRALSCRAHMRRARLRGMESPSQRDALSTLRHGVKRRSPGITLAALAIAEEPHEPLRPLPMGLGDLRNAP
jgi:hypothetical protein